MGLGSGYKTKIDSLAGRWFRLRRLRQLQTTDMHEDNNRMDRQEGGSTATGDRASAGGYAPGERRRSRTEWQRQQYRVAEPGATYDNEAQPHESDAGDT